MKVAVLSPITWRTPPRNYGPWEQVASVLTEGLNKVAASTEYSWQSKHRKQPQLIYVPCYQNIFTM
jgi:hypothetical protein